MQCKAIATVSDQAANSSFIGVTVQSEQPCSMHASWVSSAGHIVVINEHEGCVNQTQGSQQLILRLLPTGTCSSQADGSARIYVQGHPAESFDAFSKLSLKFYRGPGSVPRAGDSKRSAFKQQADQGAPSIADMGGDADITESATSLVSSAASASVHFWRRVMLAIAGDTAASVPELQTKKHDQKPTSIDEAGKRLVQPAAIQHQPSNSTLGRRLLSGKHDVF